MMASSKETTSRQKYEYHHQRSFPPLHERPTPCLRMGSRIYSDRQWGAPLFLGPRNHPQQRNLECPQQPFRSSVINDLQTDKSMTSTQLLKVCRKADPERSYQAEMTQWYHSFHKTSENRQYRLLVLPGFHKACSEFRGETWDDCAKEFLAALQAEREAATPTA